MQLKGRNGYVLTSVHNTSPHSEVKFAGLDIVDVQLNYSC